MRNLLVIVEVIILLGACLSYAQDMQDARFFRQSLCDVESRIAYGCFNLTANTRGLFDCLAVCNLENSCIGASITKNDSSCYVHTTCPSAISGCGEESADHDYYSKNCDNKGSWKSYTRSCQCSAGWVGEHCNRRPKDCGELVTSGRTMSETQAILDLSDKNLPPTEVYCVMKSVPESLSSATSSVVFMRNDGDVDVSELWEKYREGFLSSAKNLWLGLERWHILSRAGYNTMVIQTKFDEGDCKFEWCYEGVHLQPENTNYTFMFTSAVNRTFGDCGDYSMGDCFGPLQNVPFSSEDMDNDGEPDANCALKHGSGWWYESCDGPCRLMGWKQTHSGVKSDDVLIRLDGVSSNEMLARLNAIEMTLHIGHCNYTTG